MVKIKDEIRKAVVSSFSWQNKSYKKVMFGAFSITSILYFSIYVILYTHTDLCVIVYYDLQDIYVGYAYIASVYKQIILLITASGFYVCVFFPRYISNFIF